MVTQCCVCKKILDKEKNEWVPPSKVDFTKVTHTYCPHCIEVTRRLFGIRSRNPRLSSVSSK